MSHRSLKPGRQWIIGETDGGGPVNGASRRQCRVEVGQLTGSGKSKGQKKNRPFTDPKNRNKNRNREKHRHRRKIVTDNNDNAEGTRGG